MTFYAGYMVLSLEYRNLQRAKATLSTILQLNRFDPSPVYALLMNSVLIELDQRAVDQWVMYSFRHLTCRMANYFEQH